MSELFPACFSCNNNRNLLQSSSGLDDRIIVFVNPEAVIGVWLINLIIELCLILGRPLFLTYISFLFQILKLFVDFVY